MIDPVSIPLIAVLAYALCLFPVGLLLPGCPCCSICPEEVEFFRCIRLRNISPQTPPDLFSTGDAQYIHGFSAVARRLGDINAVRTCKQSSSDGSCAEWGYNIRFRIPAPFNQLANETIADFDDVQSFLKGEQPLTFTFPSLFGVASSQWEVSVSQPTPFCGRPLCAQSLRTASGGTVSDNRGMADTGVVPLTATIQYPPEVSSYTEFSSDGQQATINTCVGQASFDPLSMRLRTGFASGQDVIGNCFYQQSMQTCEGYNAARHRARCRDNWYEPPEAGCYGGVKPYDTTIPASAFYCGDLLWAIEHGPCKSSRKIARPPEDHAVITLGGNDESEWRRGYCFPNPNLQQPPFNKNKCAPLEVSFSVNETNLQDYQGSLTGCIVPSGTYVGAGGFQNCNFLLYTIGFTMTGTLGGGPCGSNFLIAAFARKKWCDPFKGGSYLCFSGGCNVADYFPERPAETVYYGRSPDFIWRPRALQAVGTVVGFSPSEEPRFSSVPSETTVSATGGTVSIAKCCPPSTVTFSVGATEEKHGRVFIVEGSGASIGKTTYVRQPGHGQFRFRVHWLNFGVSEGMSGWSQSVSPRCFYGQIEFVDEDYQAQSTDWSVSSASEWVLASKVDSGPDAGLLKILVEPSGLYETGCFTVTASDGFARTFCLMRLP